MWGSRNVWGASEKLRKRGWQYHSLPSLKQKQQWPPGTKPQDQGHPVSSPRQTEGSSLKGANGGKPTPLYNRYEALDVEGQSIDGVDNGPSIPEVLSKTEKPTSPYQDPCHKEEKADYSWFPLRGTEGAIRWTDPLLREVCCLLETRVKDITRKPHLVQPLGYYPLLLWCFAGAHAVCESDRVMPIPSQNEELGSKTWVVAFHPVFNSEHSLKLTLPVVSVLIVKKSIEKCCLGFSRAFVPLRIAEEIVKYSLNLSICFLYATCLM